MVTVDEVKGSSDSPDSPPDESLREERRRTGRYVATVIAIFVSLFGLYQAMARGTPEYAAFFLPALIMFLYVLWILYASRSRSKVSVADYDSIQVCEQLSEQFKCTREHTPTPSTSQKQPQQQPSFSRSYSIA